jgi:hypothetical protein
MFRIGIEPTFQHLQSQALPLSYLNNYNINNKYIIYIIYIIYNINNIYNIYYINNKNIIIHYLEIMEFEPIQLRCKLRILTN